MNRMKQLGKAAASPGLAQSPQWFNNPMQVHPGVNMGSMHTTGMNGSLPQPNFQPHPGMPANHPMQMLNMVQGGSDFLSQLGQHAAQQPAAPEQPGMLSQAWEGIKSTGNALRGLPGQMAASNSLTTGAAAIPGVSSMASRIGNAIPGVSALQRTAQGTGWGARAARFALGTGRTVGALGANAAGIPVGSVVSQGGTLGRVAGGKVLPAVSGALNLGWAPAQVLMGEKTPEQAFGQYSAQDRMQQNQKGYLSRVWDGLDPSNFYKNTSELGLSGVSLGGASNGGSHPLIEAGRGVGSWIHSLFGGNPEYTAEQGKQDVAALQARLAANGGAE